MSASSTPTKQRQDADRAAEKNNEIFEGMEQEDGNNMSTLDSQFINNSIADEKNAQTTTRQRKGHGRKKKKRGAAIGTDAQNQVTEMKADKEHVDDSNMNGKETNDQENAVENVGGEQKPTEVINDIADDADMLVGYSEEPLLTLAEACAPLQDILHDLSTYVQMALDETPPKPHDGLTVNESAAVRLYTIEWEKPHRSLYSMLNYTLKTTDRANIKHYFKYLKLFLTAMAKIPCSPPTTIWRGVTKNLSAEFPPGTPVIWWAVTSCTVDLTVLENTMYLGNTGSRTLFSVESINGRSVRSHSHFVTEQELLLLPGTYMEVQSIFSPAVDMYIVHMKQLKPAITLLEPPFEGAHLYPVEPVIRPWYKKKRNIFLLCVLLALALGGLIAGIVIATRPSPPPPICYTRPNKIRADLFYSFDCGDSREERHLLNNGSDQNGVTYLSPDFNGRGKALRLYRTKNQYVILPQSLNLTLRQSFTMSVWLYITGFKSQTILSDCDTSISRCVSFDIDKVINLTTLDTNSQNISVLSYLTTGSNSAISRSAWLYMSVVFNSQNQSFLFYLNGRLAALQSVNASQLRPSNPLVARKNFNKVSYIGLNLMDDLQPLNGVIDQLSIAYYVKSVDELLIEATLACSYTFDTVDINADSGPNNISAQSNLVYRSPLTYSGNQSSLVVNSTNSSSPSSILFNSSNSYFQAYDFTLIKGRFYAFTIAFWFCLSSESLNYSGSSIPVVPILQLATKDLESVDGYTCIMGISVINQYIVTTFLSAAADYSTNSEYNLNGTWVHYGVSFGNGSTITTYVNGVRVAQPPADPNANPDNDPASSLASIFHDVPRLYVTIGSPYLNLTENVETDNSMPCFIADDEPDGYDFVHMYGSIDEFIFFARAVSDTTMWNLFNSTQDYHQPMATVKS